MKRFKGTNIPSKERNTTMEKFKLDQVEVTGITLETILCLSRAINDLLEDDITLFTEYPSKDSGTRYRADRLGGKLLALSATTIQETKRAQKQIEAATNSLMKDGD